MFPWAPMAKVYGENILGIETFAWSSSGIRARWTDFSFMGKVKYRIVLAEYRYLRGTIQGSFYG